MQKTVFYGIVGVSLAVTAASLGFMASRLLSLRYYAPPPPAPKRAPAPATQAATIPPERWTNIFAPAQGMDIPSRIKSAKSREGAVSGTRYVLLGTISSDSRAARRAILWADGFKEPKLVAEQAEIEPGIRVGRIKRDEVFLIRGNTPEKLDLLPVGSRTRTPASPAAPAAPAAVPPPVAAGGMAPTIRVSQIGANAYSLDEASVTQLTNNINQYMTQVRIIPYFEGNRSAGYRIAAIRPGSAFEQLGFRGGDVIQRINDVDLVSPEKMYTIFQNLRDEKRVNVNIIRQGQKSTITYEIR